MTCCESILQTFTEELITTVPYNGEFGDEPQVDVMYLVGDEWHAAGVFTSISRTPTEITVDHGGEATGVIKIS